MRAIRVLRRGERGGLGVRGAGADAGRRWWAVLVLIWVGWLRLLLLRGRARAEGRGCEGPRLCGKYSGRGRECVRSEAAFIAQDFTGMYPPWEGRAGAVRTAGRRGRGRSGRGRRGGGDGTGAVAAGARTCIRPNRRGSCRTASRRRGRVVVLLRVRVRVLGWRRRVVLVGAYGRGSKSHYLRGVVKSTVAPSEWRQCRIGVVLVRLEIFVTGGGACLA
ncbi:hypothetical protein K438DRAFT_1810275 [Mycena galopus ATCC 62051]|nr:hypothetical protein K438DRAFT_1810275 [Mycena galopus ATCC 62051]